MKIDVSFVAFHSQEQVYTFIQRIVYSFEKHRVKAYCEVPGAVHPKNMAQLLILIS